MFLRIFKGPDGGLDPRVPTGFLGRVLFFGQAQRTRTTPTPYPTPGPHRGPAPTTQTRLAAGGGEVVVWSECTSDTMSEITRELKIDGFILIGGIGSGPKSP